jgi:acyl-coenzyme A thioesterase PaaI-like protein
MPIGEEIRFDDPDNMCFGCSPHNERGLQLAFTQVSASGVRVGFTAPEHSCGAPGVIHGGIQAALLDEAIGFAVFAHDHSGGDPSAAAGAGVRRNVVTVEFDLRYRRPAPVGVELDVRAEVVHVSGKDYLAVAQLLGTDGAVLTSATARWRRLD